MENNIAISHCFAKSMEWSLEIDIETEFQLTFFKENATSNLTQIFGVTYNAQP